MRVGILHRRLTAIAAKNQIQARRNLVAIYTSLLRNGRLAASEVPAVRKALSAALFGEARAMRNAGQSLGALSPLLGSALRHPAHLTGFGKAALLLLLGNRRYERLTAAQRGFHREDFEA